MFGVDPVCGEPFDFDDVGAVYGLRDVAGDGYDERDV